MLDWSVDNDSQLLDAVMEAMSNADFGMMGDVSGQSWTKLEGGCCCVLVVLRSDAVGYINMSMPIDKGQANYRCRG